MLFRSPESVAVDSIGVHNLSARVLARSYLGDRIEYLLETPAGLIKGCSSDTTMWAEGEVVSVKLDPALAAALPEE